MAEQPRYDNAFNATLNGIRDLFRKRERIGVLQENERLDGQTVLVTGANSGLGFAIAMQCAQRGARVLMACRSGIPEAGQAVRAVSGSDQVSMLRVDLADLRSIEALVHQLAEDGVVLDRLICNAAVVPAGPVTSPQSLEGMYVVNVLSKAALIRGLWARGVLRADADRPARVIFVSSESHRSGANVVPSELGSQRSFSMAQVVGLYGYYKLALTTLAVAYDRLWNERSALGEKGHGPASAEGPGVFVLCPGPVNSNIARAAPGWAKPLLRVVFRLFFQSPAKAAEPVLYLACAANLTGRSGQYLHGMSPKPVDARAADPAAADVLLQHLYGELDRVAQD